MTERENAEDHHFEPVSARAGLIKAKRNRRKIRQLHRQKLSRLMKAASNISLDSSRTAKTEKSSEADADISDQQIEPFGEQMAIPVSDLGSPVATYTPPTIFIPRSSVTEIGDIPISGNLVPMTYRPEFEDDIVALKPSHGQVILRSSKETDV